jgi:hypothetical protein
MVVGIGIGNIRRWLPLGSIAATIAALVAAPWYIYLYRTYGNFSALEQVKALQYNWTYRYSEPPSILDQLLDKKFAHLRWQETWGEFGWRLIHLEAWVLIAIGVPLFVFAVSALFVVAKGTWQRWRRSGSEAILSREQVIGLWLLLITAVVAYGAMLQFGTTFALTQARYYFNAVGPIAVLLALGFRQLMPVRFRPIGVVVFLVFMVGVNVVIFSQSVIPYWYLPS